MDTQNTQTAERAVVALPLDKIVASPYQVRADGDEDLRALADELRALSVRCLALAAAVSEIDDERLGDEGLQRLAAGLALDLAPWGDMRMPLRRHPAVDPRAYAAADIVAAHPADWKLDDEGRLRDLLGKPVEVPSEAVAPLLATLRNTERYSRWRLDDARRDLARLRRRLRKERERNRQYEPKRDWSVKDALALANTLANHGLRDGNADAASSCIYSLCRTSPGNNAAMREAQEGGPR